MEHLMTTFVKLRNIQMFDFRESLKWKTIVAPNCRWMGQPWWLIETKLDATGRRVSSHCNGALSLFKSVRPLHYNA